MKRSIFLAYYSVSFCLRSLLTMSELHMCEQEGCKHQIPSIKHQWCLWPPKVRWMKINHLTLQIFSQAEKFDKMSNITRYQIWHKLLYQKNSILNPFVPTTPFLYPLKTSENLTVFWCFQWVEKEWLGTNGLIPLNVYSRLTTFYWVLSIAMINIKLENKNKNKLKSAKRFRNNHLQCSTVKSLKHKSQFYVTYLQVKMFIFYTS